MPIEYNVIDTFVIQNNFLLRIVLAILIVPIAFTLVKIVRRIDPNQLKIGDPNANIVKVQLAATGIYLLAAIIILLILFMDYSSEAQGLASLYKILEEHSAFVRTNGFYLKGIAMIAAIWIGAHLVIKYFSNIFYQIDAAIEAINLSSHIHQLMKTVFTYAIYGVAIVLSLKALGLDDWLATALASAGIAGIIIGFAAQDTFKNFVSGALVILDKSFELGEDVEIMGSNIRGKVEDIKMRTTKIRTLDNIIITVPNSILANNPLINYSASFERRFEIKIGIAYEANIDKAKKIIKETIKEHPATCRDPSINILTFGASSVDLSALIWLDSRRMDLLEAKTQISQNIKEALDKNGIEIPYPKQVLLRDELMHPKENVQDKIEEPKKDETKAKRKTKSKQLI